MNKTIIQNYLKDELLPLLKTPVSKVSTVSETESYKHTGLKLGAIALIFAVLSIILCHGIVYNTITKDSLSGSYYTATSEDVKDSRKYILDKFDFGEIFFKTGVASAISIGAYALATSKAAKSTLTFQRALSISTNIGIIHTILLLLAGLCLFIYMPLAICIIYFSAILGSIVTTLVSREAMGEISSDKFALLSSIVVFIPMIILYFIAKNIFSDYFEELFYYM